MTDVAITIKHDGHEPEFGVCPVGALPYYEGKGYKAVDADEVKAAREADGITAADAKQVSDQIAEDLGNGTAAGSAEDKSKGRGRASADS